MFIIKNIMENHHPLSNIKVNVLKTVMLLQNIISEERNANKVLLWNTTSTYEQW